MAGAARPTPTVTRDELAYALNWGFKESGGMTEAQKRELAEKSRARGSSIAPEKHVEFTEQAALAAVKFGSVEKMDLATKKRLLEILGIRPSPAALRNFQHLITTRLGKQLSVANKAVPKAIAEAEKKGETLDAGDAKLEGIAKSVEVMQEKSTHKCAYPPCGVTDLGARAFALEARAFSSLRACMGCSQVWYCSREHQKAHWKAEGGHRADCQKAQAAQALLASQKV